MPYRKANDVPVCINSSSEPTVVRKPIYKLIANRLASNSSIVKILQDPQLSIKISAFNAKLQLVFVL